MLRTRKQINTRQLYKKWNIKDTRYTFYISHKLVKKIKNPDEFTIDTKLTYCVMFCGEFQFVGSTMKQVKRKIAIHAEERIR